MLDIERSGHVAVVTLQAVPSPGDWLQALDPLLDDDGVRVLLVNATATTAVDGEWTEEALRPVRLWRKPSVIAIDGVVAGPLATFATAFDIRVAGNGATIAGAPAEDARRKGDVFAVAVDPLEEAMRLAEVVASRGPLATRLAKEAIWRGSELPFEHALRFETDLTLLLQTTKDRSEGVAAFIEKRQPHFTGS